MPSTRLAQVTHRATAGLALLAAGLASAAGVHQHGVGQAAVVLEDTTLQVEVTIPLMDVLGTEAAPRDEEQATQYEQRLAQIADAGQPIALPAAARCELAHYQRASVDSLFGHDGHRHEEHHTHDHHDDHEHHGKDNHDHKDHQHDHQHGHDHNHDHQHEDGHLHPDFTASWTFNCTAPENLGQIELTFLEQLPQLTLEVILLLPAGQSAATLAPGERTVTLAE